MTAREAAASISTLLLVDSLEVEVEAPSSSSIELAGEVKGARAFRNVVAQGEGREPSSGRGTYSGSSTDSLEDAAGSRESEGEARGDVDSSRRDRFREGETNASCSTVLGEGERLPNLR